MKIDLYLMRHGETENNKRGILAGRIDMPLAETGVQELKALAANYPCPQPEVVYVSPLSRCLETAKIIFPEPIQKENVRFEDNLIEMDFGCYESTAVRDFVNTELHLKWVAREPDFCFPGGETFQHVHERMVAGLDRVVSDCENSGIMTVGIVSHNMLIVELMRNYLDVDPGEAGRMCPNGMGFHLLIDTDIWKTQRKLSCVKPLPVGAPRPKPSESPYVKIGK